MIEFRELNVNFRQKGKAFHAVKNVTFQIEDGEIFGIVGSSGAGKSTVLRTINLLQRPTSGEVVVDGRNIVNYKRKELRNLRKEIGMIFQHFNLASNKTVYSNIAFAMKAAGKKKEEIDKKVSELLSLVGLKEYRNAYPSRLSGGQKQRVAIARALANDAKILLCDEPTSALDLETTKAILDLLRNLNEKLGITVVIITHELDVVKSICDRAAVMNNGELIEVNNIYHIFTSSEHEFTRQLVQHDAGYDLPENILGHTKGRIIRIRYQGEEANNPVLAEMAELFGIKTNILLGKIEYIGELPLGILYVQIDGDERDIENALTYLKTHTEDVEFVINTSSDGGEDKKLERSSHEN